MKRIVRMPEHLDGLVIENCFDCPFSNRGDEWAIHCNVKQIAYEKGTMSSSTSFYYADFESCPYLEKLEEGTEE